MTCRAASGATICAGASPTGAQLAYDNQGQLAQWLSAPANPTSSASYLYDGEGNRVQQVTTTSGATTTSSYIGSLEEVTTSGTTTTTTAYYGGLALSVNGALSYTLSDGLGSVSASVNASTGVVSATQLYGPYGAVRYQSGALPTSYGYTHQRSDAVSGLDYYGARYYDPLAGQFTSADIMLAGGLNRYAYVGGNPETRTDPSGHIPVTQTRAYSPQLAYSQWLAQPTHTYYGSVGAFVSDSAQFFLGTDTLSQSYHTLFQDPHASAGDKWKAAGVGVLTLGTDAVTIGSTLVGDPEVGTAARGGEAALLAAEDAEHAAAAVAEAEVTAAAEASTETNETWYRALRSGEDPSNGLSPRNPNNRVSALQHVRGGSRGSGDQFISFTKDPVVAVNKYAGGDPSRVVAINPSGVTGTVYDLTTASVRRAIGMMPGSPAWNFALADSEVLLEDGYVPPEAISPFSGSLW